MSPSFFDRKTISYDSIKYGDYEDNIKWFDEKYKEIEVPLLCGDEEVWPDKLHFPKVEFFLFSCYNHWAWNKNAGPLMRRVYLDTTVLVENVFNLESNKYVPKVKVGTTGVNYGKIGAGAISVQWGGVVSSYIYPELIKKYLKKQR